MSDDRVPAAPETFSADALAADTAHLVDLFVRLVAGEGTATDLLQYWPTIQRWGEDALFALGIFAASLAVAYSSDDDLEHALALAEGCVVETAAFLISSPSAAPTPPSAQDCGPG